MQNIHPLVVHFPIALLLLGIVFHGIGLFRRNPTIDTLSQWTLYLGTLGAALAAISGWLGEQSVATVAAAHDSIEEHEKLGYITLGTAALLSFWRAGTAPHGGPRPRWIFVLGLAGLGYLLWATTHEGGELVYEYGVGTELTAPGGPLAEEPDTTHVPPDVPRGEDFR